MGDFCNRTDSDDLDDQLDRKKLLTFFKNEGPRPSPQRAAFEAISIFESLFVLVFYLTPLKNNKVVREQNMAEIVSFSRTSEQYEKYAERGITRRIKNGQMTEADAELIKEFVDSLKSQNNISDSRAYKLTNALSNISRFIKTPFMENKIADIRAGVSAIKSGKKINAKNQKTPGDLSQNVKRDYIIFLKRFYLWSIEEGYCNLPPEKIRKIRPPSPDRVTKTAGQMLTNDEVLRMICACTGSTGIRDKAMLSVLYEAGLRINELAGLFWSDVLFDSHFAKLNVSSKTGIPRYIPLTTSRGYLAAWRSIYPDGEPEGDKPVFVTTIFKIKDKDEDTKVRTINDGSTLPLDEIKDKDKDTKVRTVTYKNLTYNYLRNHIKDIGKRAGIQKSVNCHVWRHSRITGMLQAGFSESVIKLMCWGSLTSDMLANYGHLCNNDIDSAVAKAAGLQIDGMEMKDSFKSKICPRCHHTNNPTTRFCEVCGAILDKETALEIEDAKEEIRADERYIKMFMDLKKKVEALEALQG